MEGSCLPKIYLKRFANKFALPFSGCFNCKLRKIGPQGILAFVLSLKIPGKNVLCQHVIKIEFSDKT